MDPNAYKSHTAMYLVIFGLLMALLFATVAVAYYDLGASALPITLLIAFTKAGLVILFFMHVIYSKKLTWIVALGGFLWFGILLTFTFSDYLTRDWLEPPAPATQQASDR
jgi:cytochrome c oxidase subunit 4